MESAKLTSREIKNLKRLVDPFIQQEHAQSRLAVAGGIDRGVVISMGDGTRISVRVLTLGESE